LIELFEYLARPEDDGDSLALAALEGLAVDGAREVHDHAIVLRRLALDSNPSGTLQAELLDHCVEIGHR
jgi:hypothetical protein